MICENPSCSSMVNSGTRLCDRCLDNLYQDLRTIPALYEALGVALTAKGVQGDRVSGTQEAKGISLSQPALDARVLIDHRVRFWTSFVFTARGVTKAKPGIDCGVAFLLTHANYLASSPANAGLFYSDVREMANGAPWRAAYPQRSRKFVVGRCPKIMPEGRCEGEISAILRKLDDSLPSKLMCEINPEHVWEDSEWLSLGNHMQRMGMIS